MKSYTELNAMPAEAFRNPQLFITEADKFPANIARGYAKAQYRKGVETGTEWDTIIISAHTVWGAEMNEGMKSLSSYEGIGYHACTADLLRGFLDSPARIVIYRYTENGISETEIKPCTK